MTQALTAQETFRAYTKNYAGGPYDFCMRQEAHRKIGGQPGAGSRFYTGGQTFWQEPEKVFDLKATIFVQRAAKFKIEH